MTAEHLILRSWVPNKWAGLCCGAEIFAAARKLLEIIHQTGNAQSNEGNDAFFRRMPLMACLLYQSKAARIDHGPPPPCEMRAAFLFVGLPGTHNDNKDFP